MQTSLVLNQRKPWREICFPNGEWVLALALALELGIFAAIGETYGFAGCALVLSLYALLIWRGLHILTVAKNLYGALIAGGITVMLLFQLFVNIGMNVGIMPITGVTAPLLSFGGSSMLATFLALGLLHSVHAQARETTELKGRATVFQ